MEQSIEDAIETLDSARQHKCELEGRKSQLQHAIFQVTNTADIAKKEVESYFLAMQEKIVNEIEKRQRCLIDEINTIEEEALNPLKDCQMLVDEGIEEASAVIDSGENMLNYDLESKTGLGQVKKFISLTRSLSLDSVPEVPRTVDVASISILFNPDCVSAIVRSIHSEGNVCSQSPVQILSLKDIPGGIIVDWRDLEDIAFDQTPVYRLQSYHGKLNISNKSMHSQGKSSFKDEYIGPCTSFVVRNLQSNSVYTFRVSRSPVNADNYIHKQWGPWSVCQEKMTVMPGFTWDFNDNEAYVLTENNKVATKKSSVGSAQYSVISSFMIGFPICLKVEKEGKFRGKNDCIALCAKRDVVATGLHTKEGALCLMSDGHVWVNGTCSKTKFASLARGMVVTFQLSKSENKLIESKKNKILVYRAVITVGELEAVFDWVPSKSETINSQSLAFAVFFQSPGWRVSVL